MAKEAEDYLEHTHGDIEPVNHYKPTLKEDMEQAEKNRQAAEEKQQELLEKTAERYWLEDDEVEDFLCESYADKESSEYLVDGAILTCTNCTREDVCYEVKGTDDGPVAIEKIYKATIDSSIDDSMFPDNDIKVFGKLKVTENLTANSNGLMHATIKDCIKGKNIPSFGNCLRGPDSVWEKDIFRKMDFTEREAKEKEKAGEEAKKTKEYRGGTCRYLMRLESEWENYEIGQKFQSFDDDVHGNKTGITMTSILFCKHGGIIFPVYSGQMITNIANEEETEEEQVNQLLSEPDISNPQAVKEYMWNYFCNAGFSEYAVAGILGNVHAETGGTFDPSLIKEGKIPRYGLFQLGGGRENELFNRGKEHAKELGLPEEEWDKGWINVQVQCEYTLWEYHNSNDGWIENTLHSEKEGNIVGTKDKFENAQSGADAALIWALSYERCVNIKIDEETGKKIIVDLQGLPTRKQQAEDIYLEFASGN